MTQKRTRLVLSLILLIRHQESCSKDSWLRRPKRKKGTGGENRPLARLPHSESTKSRGVMAVGWMEQSGEWIKVKACMDSGCIEHVAPPEIAPGVAATPSELSMAGQCYSVANGEDIPNVGEKTFEAITEGGQRGTMTTQLAEVTKPLMSVGQTCDNGNVVLFHRRGGFILNLETRALTPFERIAGNYEIAYWVKGKADPNRSDFAGQKL